MGPAGASPSAAQVEALLAADKTFVAAVAAAMAGTPVVVTPPVVTPPVTGNCARPAGNTGTGMYVACGTLRNVNGTQFIAMGANRAHYDQAAANGLNIAGANIARTFYTTQYGWTLAQLGADITSLHTAHIVAIATLFYGTSTTCSTDPAVVTANVQGIINDAATWKAADIVNLANEWGSAANWESTYATLIPKVRAAGLLQPLLIDFPQCGQDQTVQAQAAALLAADPQHNLVFSSHIYGGTANAAAMQAWAAKLSAATAANGTVFMFGEFGPGANVGPSPTMLAPDDVILAAQANGMGWLAWAWDDNSGAGCAAGTNWFDMQLNACSTPYTGSASQLTPFGVDIVAQWAKLKPVRAPNL